MIFVGRLCCSPDSKLAFASSSVADAVFETSLTTSFAVSTKSPEFAENFADGKLALESYKEYIELFARSLKETMESREGVSYLLRSVGFDVQSEEINLNPELRWKKGPGAFGSSLL